MIFCRLGCAIIERVDAVGRKCHKVRGPKDMPDLAFGGQRSRPTARRGGYEVREEVVLDLRARSDEYPERERYFFPSLREISSTIFGRMPARTLSTMLAISGDS